MNAPLLPQLVTVDEAGSAWARHYRTGDSVRVSWEKGIITSIEPVTGEAEDSPWIAPALMDVQVNGYAGVDFQRIESLQEDALVHAVRALRRDGCHRILLTLITSPWDVLCESIRRGRAIIEKNPELRRAIVGWHLEGPFLSDVVGFCGAHQTGWMVDPTPGHIHELCDLVKGDPVLLTLAPERKGAAVAIREAVKSGFVVSAGHTNASSALLNDAAESGLRAFTHLGNGCPQLLDRHDNILWRVLEEPQLMAGLIPDGIHVSPSLFSILHRVMGPDRVYWTTDAMAAAGGSAGKYSLGNLEVVVGEDRVVRHPVTGGFAGSALEPIEGVRRGAQMLGISWREAWDYLSTRPARFMGQSADLVPGSPAGFCFLRGA